MRNSHPWPSCGDAHPAELAAVRRTVHANLAQIIRFLGAKRRPGILDEGLVTALTGQVVVCDEALQDVLERVFQVLDLRPKPDDLAGMLEPVRAIFIGNIIIPLNELGHFKHLY